MSKTNTTVSLEDQSGPKVFTKESSESVIKVLAVDDNPDLLDLTATFLEKEREKFDVITTGSVDEALGYIEEKQIDAIVSDYDMPGRNGLHFLEAIREKWENIPFILFTGKGSEEIASEAISKGVTDYLQKGTGASQYSLLSNRIINSVEQYKTSQKLKQSQEKFSKLVKNSTDMLGIVDESGEFNYISPACKHILGYEQEELIGECAFEYMPTDDRQSAMEDFFEAVEKPEKKPVIEHRFKTKEGGTTLLETRGQNMFDDDFINGFVVNARDITDLKRREQELEQQNEQLKDMRNVIAHDLRNPLSVASDSLELYQTTDNEEYLEKIDTSLERIDTLIERVVTMAEYETKITETDQIPLAEIARDAWQMVETPNAALHVDDSKQFEADTDRLQQVFENIFRNAIEHNTGEITVRVGTMETGIYIEDTGTGIPEENRSDIFESGYTTEPENTGFGLNIVKQIVVGHGWQIQVTDGEDRGARFEITEMTFQPMVCE